MEVEELYRRTSEWFGEHVHRVTERQWDAPTPCVEWSVAELVNHVVGEERWVPPLLRGDTIEAVGNRFDGDLLGTDPAGAWNDAVKGALAAVRSPGASQRTVHLSYGDESAEQYLRQLVAEHLVHGWDLAAATGHAHREPDAELVEAVATWFDHAEDLYRGAGGIADRVTVDADAGAFPSLLARFGRRPDWTPAMGVVEQVNAAIVEGDLETMARWLADDVVFDTSWPPPDGERIEGRQAVTEFFARMLEETTDPRLDIEELAACGDRVVQRHRYSWREPDGGEGHVRGVDLYRVEDARVKEMLVYVKG